MSEPIEPTLNNFGSGTLGAIIMALLGLLYKLAAPKVNSDTTPRVNDTTQKTAADERLDALQHRIATLEASVTHIDHKVDNISVDIARAVGELGTISASMRGNPNGRVR